MIEEWLLVEERDGLLLPNLVDRALVFLILPLLRLLLRLRLLLLLRFLLLLRLLRLRLLLLLLLRLRLLSMLQQHRLLLALLLSRGRPRIKCWNRLTLAQYAT